MIITLCGSTRFMEDFHAWNRRLTLAGNLVFSVSTSVKGSWKPTRNEKEFLNEMHKKKIDNSDAILVLNHDNYIGESTASEIQYACKKGILILYAYQYGTELSVKSSSEIEKICTST